LSQVNEAHKQFRKGVIYVYKR